MTTGCKSFQVTLRRVRIEEVVIDCIGYASEADAVSAAKSMSCTTTGWETVTQAELGVRDIKEVK